MARKWIAKVALLLSLAGCAAAAPDLRSAAPASIAREMALTAVEIASDADLSHVADMIGDAQIVMIGEQWHGDGGGIALLARLVKHLHARHGFEVLVFESDFYAAQAGWQRVVEGAPVATLKPEIYAFWSDSPAAAPLWDYIGAQASGNRPLLVAGMDTKLVGRSSREGFPEAFRTRLALTRSIAPAEAAAAAETLSALLRGEQAKVSAGSFERLLRVARLFEAEMKSSEDEFWTQMSESLRRNLTDPSRDPGMASNLLWLANNQFRGRRIIVWGHNNHVLTDKWMVFDSPDAGLRKALGELPTPALTSTTFVGALVKHAVGPRLVSIGTISHSGEYSTDVESALTGGPMNFSATRELPPAPAGTLEAALASRCREGTVRANALACDVRQIG